MYHLIENRFRRALVSHIRKVYQADLAVATSQPPKIEMGEIASPVCFELAKLEKRPPRLLAQEIAVALKPIEGIERVEVAGGGYLNAFIDRSAFFDSARRLAGHEALAPKPNSPKTIVEHTSINPNKAAHVGHVRNAVLGDTFSRILRHAGHHVEVQNYIDNTGVQVADVVLGFVHIEKKSAAEVRALASQRKFDYLCWDLYARVTHFLEEDGTRAAIRLNTLKVIEEGRGAEAEIADIIATAILRCHLRTLDRLGISYDLLARESETLTLKFWDAAFNDLRARGAIRLSTSGKNVGCWVMDLAEATSADAADESPEQAQEGADAKIIVRSNGTVTYVGKDIAYHLWKFGVLARDFLYRPFHTHPNGHVSWITCSENGEKNPPQFGQAHDVYNVIDTRQAYPQQVVVAGLRALGYVEQAARLVHLNYDVVALTPRCAAEMGYVLSDAEAAKPFVEVSGRKGQGVKADDLLDQIEGRARAEVDSRHPESPEEQRAAVAHAISAGALRYFLLKFTRNSIIAFDFKDALSFDGETGPYIQYAIVRAQSIFRKLAEREPDFRLENAPLASEEITRMLTPPAGNDLWTLLLAAGSLGAHIQAAIKTQEPAFVAKYAFALAQAFNLFYHKHKILAEEAPDRRTFLLHLTEIVRMQLLTALTLMGIEAPDKM